MGLDYLTLHRSAGTLSGGKPSASVWLLRLARADGGLYILDEPSIGLHQRDNGRLIETLKSRGILGNTVLVVEHDEDTYGGCGSHY